MENIIGLLMVILTIGFFSGLFFIGMFAFIQIAKKAGYHPILGLLVFVPFLNIIIFLIFAYSKWPVYNCLDEEKAKLCKSISKPISKFAVIGCAIPFFILCAAIMIPSMIGARISANDALAQSALRAMATSAEKYKYSNDEKYPKDMKVLTGASPAYLKTDYCNQLMQGFYYECQMSETGYVFIATPVDVGTSGTKTFTVKTGGVFSQ